MKTIDVEIAVVRMFGLRRHFAIVPNVSWGLLTHEVDLLVVRKTGFAVEVEIKVSATDLRKDFKKRHQHRERGNRICEMYYAVPKKLEALARELVSDEHGIIVVDTIPREQRMGGALIGKTVKDATRIKTARPLTESEMLQVARLGSMRIWTLKQKLVEVRIRKEGE